MSQLGQIIWACLNNHNSWADLVDCQFATIKMCEDDVGMGVHSTYVVMEAQGFAQLCRTNGLAGSDITALGVTRLIGLQ